ncbi:MAG TPA: copper amine oxidase N-terminal domain-containing protein [Symbiobacteriaceae bacterium]|nr:copper amine oxidase N-terminal domain-containing protein [Symbiobacteriaceae bacterium]
MKRDWLKTTAATMSLLAVMAGTAMAADRPLNATTGETVIEAAPIKAETVTLEGTLTYSDIEGGYDLEGWRLLGDQALLAQLKGQRIWVLGTEHTGPSTHTGRRLTVERIERAVAMNRALPANLTVNGKAVRYDQAPYMHKGTLMLPLRALVEAAGGTIEWRPESWSAYVLLSDRTAYFTVGESKAEMYLHAARYIGRNFLQMDQSVVLKNGRMFISADALTSVLGMNEDVTADESNLALRFPQFQFDVADDVYLTQDLQWNGHRLQISGKSSLPDLQFQVLLDGKVIGEADATVKDGAYIANVLVEGGPEQAGKLELAILDPITRRELIRTQAHTN